MTNLEKLIKMNEGLKQPYVLKKLSRDNYFLATQDFINYLGLDGTIFSSKDEKKWIPCIRTFNQAKSILKIKSLIDTREVFKLKIVLSNRTVLAGKDDEGLYIVDYSKEIFDFVTFRVMDILDFISRDDFVKIEVMQ